MSHRYLYTLLLQGAALLSVLLTVAYGWARYRLSIDHLELYFTMALSVGLILMVGYQWLYFHHLRYVMREDDISICSGVIFKRIATQPFSRIQHVEVSRGPLERVFGLATLKLFSAGGALHSIAVPGLEDAQAALLRDTIVAQTGVTFDS